jgi:hypothetical protein
MDDPISPHTARLLMAGFVLLTAILVSLYFFTGAFSYTGVR